MFNELNTLREAIAAVALSGILAWRLALAPLMLKAFDVDAKRERPAGVWRADLWTTRIRN
jgi:hypothetical protein